MGQQVKVQLEQSKEQLAAWQSGIKRAKNIPEIFALISFQCLNKLLHHFLHNVMIAAKRSILFFFLHLLALSIIYRKELIPSSTALCLDGSPSLIYVSTGNPTKILLHFQSGGWCGKPSLNSTIQECYQRSLTSLGSSKYSPQTMTFTYGILSDQQPNHFNNWTRIFLGYCDGAGHQGSGYPVKYKNSLLYFRGTNITIQRFDYLQKRYGLYSQTDEVVLSGASAGGLATYFWGNYLKTKLLKAKYYIIADSGIFLNSINFVSHNYDIRESFKQLLILSNSLTDPPISQCIQTHPFQKELCMFPQYIIEYLSVPVFAVQSLYDAWAIANILGINCSSKYELSGCTEEERRYIEEYRVNTTQVLDKLRRLGVKNGFWANGCVYHGYTYFSAYNSQRFRIPSGSDNSINYCIEQWDSSQKNMYYQDRELWPNNKGCSNQQELALQLNY